METDDSSLYQKKQNKEKQKKFEKQSEMLEQIILENLNEQLMEKEERTC